MADKTFLNFEVSPDLYDKIKTETDRLGIGTVAGFMRMLAVQYFEKREVKVGAETGDVNNVTQ